MAEMSTGTLSLSDWVSVANLVVALGAMGVAIVALVVARRTLKEAEEDWKQQKWFDLYAKADEAHSLLVRYKKVYPTVLQTPTIEGKQDWNALMSVFLEAYTMAGCFPVNPAVDSLLAATGAGGRVR